MSLCPADTLQIHCRALQRSSRLIDYLLPEILYWVLSVLQILEQIIQEIEHNRENLLWYLFCESLYWHSSSDWICYTDYIMDLLWAVFHHLSLNNPKLDFGKPNFVTVSSFLFKFNAWYSIKTLLCGGCGPPLPIPLSLSPPTMSSLCFMWRFQILRPHYSISIKPGAFLNNDE